MVKNNFSNWKAQTAALVRGWWISLVNNVCSNKFMVFLKQFLHLSSFVMRGSFRFLWRLSNKCNWVIKLYSWKLSKQKLPFGCTVCSQVFFKSVKLLFFAIFLQETSWTMFNVSKNSTASTTYIFDYNWTLIKVLTVRWQIKQGFYSPHKEKVFYRPYKS